MATKHVPFATAAADPPEEPPGLNLPSIGFFTGAFIPFCE
jgi:hypothetical protein|tara:strand:- start:8 stop:127 length:120 start_codon:yes stop_codon:yes gene_type:complete